MQPCRYLQAVLLDAPHLQVAPYLRNHCLDRPMLLSKDDFRQGALFINRNLQSSRAFNGAD